MNPIEIVEHFLKSTNYNEWNKKLRLTSKSIFWNCIVDGVKIDMRHESYSPVISVNDIMYAQKYIAALGDDVPDGSAFAQMSTITLIILSNSKVFIVDTNKLVEMIGYTPESAKGIVSSYKDAKDKKIKIIYQRMIKLDDIESIADVIIDLNSISDKQNKTTSFVKPILEKSNSSPKRLNILKNTRNRLTK